jgi:hypothetical protein
MGRREADAGKVLAADERGQNKRNFAEGGVTADVLVQSQRADTSNA